MSKMMY